MTAADRAKAAEVPCTCWQGVHSHTYATDCPQHGHIAAAIAAARADADARWKAAVEGLAESAPHTDACLDRMDATRGTCTCDRPIPAARLRGLTTSSEEQQ